MIAEYHQKLMDLTTTPQTIYIGIGAVGISTSELGWTIQRILFDIDGNPISSQWTTKDTAIWDDRNITIYQ